MIYTGHISITEKEIDYVTDALKYGWDKNATGYIRRFEEAFAEYVGVKYARSLSGGTQALTLAIAALGIGKGDEVILPEITYFACSDVIKLAGATPVFVDINPINLCIDPDSFERAITPRTKAVMPVWIYGNAPEMAEIMKIAQVYDLRVIEDACPAVGTFYQRKHAGSFGDFGCFSFHAAKIITTGFGGMLVTNDKKLYDRAIFLADHGEDKTYPTRFWQTEVGYTFDLANINCAFGLAQLERIEELVQKHRQIWYWYNQRLSDLGQLNYEQEAARLNMSMITFVMNDLHLPRQTVIDRLRERRIDSRPIFFPISSFPMYKKQKTPYAHMVSANGINLPFGVQLTEQDIDYICNTLRGIICKQS